MNDFTLTTYRLLLEALKKRNYTFFPFSAFLETKSSLANRNSSIIILRHDVDRLPGNSLATARIENEMGIRGSYYFRIVQESFNEKIIKRIAELGHEIGYHYEDVNVVMSSQKSEVRSQNGSIDEEKLIDLAYESFCKNLQRMREVADIKTICMHGSPLSKFDNKMIWSQRDAFGRKYNYKDLGIIGEPYFDINWNEFGYLTDTGRRWDGVAIRDKVKSSFQDQRLKDKGKSKFKKTQDIIANINSLPDKMMFTIHPERWTDDWFLWSKQLVFQNVKNVVKRVLIKTKD